MLRIAAVLTALLLTPWAWAETPMPEPAQAREQAQQRSRLHLEQREYLKRQGVPAPDGPRRLEDRLQRQQRALQALQHRQAREARQLRLRQGVGLPAPGAAGLRLRQEVERRSERLRLRGERAGWLHPAPGAPSRARLPALER